MPFQRSNILKLYNEIQVFYGLYGPAKIFQVPLRLSLQAKPYRAVVQTERPRDFHEVTYVTTVSQNMVISQQ